MSADGRVTMPFTSVDDTNCTVEFDPHTPIGRRLAAHLGGEMLARTADAKQMDIEHDVTGVNPENAAKVGGIAADRLRSLIERIERLEEERRALGSDIKDIYSEAKSDGFDVKVLRQLINTRRKDPADVEEQETLLDVYRRALGM